MAVIKATPTASLQRSDININSVGEAIIGARNNAKAIKQHIADINVALTSLAQLGLYNGHKKQAEFEKQAGKDCHKACLVHGAILSSCELVDGCIVVRAGNKPVIEMVLEDALYAEAYYQEQLMIQELYLELITDAVLLSQTPDLDLMMHQAICEANRIVCQ